jgi:hypothetical protein
MQDPRSAFGEEHDDGSKQPKKFRTEGEEEEKAQCQPLTADFSTKRVTWILG